MKKAIVTGACGFIGSSLVNFLLKEKYYVVGIDCVEDIYKRINSSLGKYDFINTKNEQWSQNTIFEQAEIIYHLGWGLSNYKNGSGYEGCLTELENIKFACQMAQLSVTYKIKKFVFVGSNYEYMLYYKEKPFLHKNAKSNIYGIAKHCAGDLCRKICIDNDIEFNNVYLANTFGKGDYSNKAVNTFIRKMLNNEQLNLIDGEQITDWMYIDDTVYGLYCVGLQGKNLEDYYIAKQEESKFQDLIYLLKNISNSNSELTFGMFIENAGIEFSSLDRNKIYQDTNFRVTDTLENQFIQTVNWIKLIDSKN